MNRSQHNEIMRMVAATELMRAIPEASPVEFEYALDKLDRNFERIFGVGDEVQVNPVNTNQAMFDAGFKQSDFYGE